MKRIALLVALLSPMFLSSCGGPSIKITLKHVDKDQVVTAKIGKKLKIKPHYVEGQVLLGYFDQEKDGRRIINAFGESINDISVETPVTLYPQFEKAFNHSVNLDFLDNDGYGTTVREFDIEGQGKKKTLYSFIDKYADMRAHLSVFPDTRLEGSISFKHWEEKGSITGLVKWSNWVNYSVKVAGEEYKTGKLEANDDFVTETISIETTGEKLLKGINITFEVPGSNFSPAPSHIRNAQISFSIR